MISLIAHLVCVAYVIDVANCFSINGNRQFVRSNHALRFEKQSQMPLFESKRRITGRLSMVTTDRPAAALPRHKELVEGKLSNGFSYVILPNSVPAGRFEAHLEVLSGSAHELDQQQGMAHLLEHVAYMGSPKRQLISGTGSRTNAYTDFHHTVFFAACPTEASWKKPILPMALDALLDVMTTTVDDGRLEQERAAVLSEASMVNKMEYRVECQVLSALHSENRISTRFPIGKENLIKIWRKEDVQLYHNTHYRPDNVILYIVGDVEIESTIKIIRQKFGNLVPKIDAAKLLRESGEFPESSMRMVSRHFPPVIHRWSCPESKVDAFVPPELQLTVPPPLTGNQKMVDGMIPTPRIFSHELLQSFSFHLFAKRPIEPVVTHLALRRDIMRRMALSALQIRFNVNQRQDPLFTFVDFNQLNWPREGCAVCSLDLTTEPTTWKSAVQTAVVEIRRLGLFGLTESELVRYKQAIISEAEHSEAQADHTTNEDVLAELMEAQACGHVYMHPSQRLQATADALDSIVLEDVNKVTKELCEHLSHINAAEGIRPAAVIACAPLMTRDNLPFTVTEEEVAEVIASAMTIPLTPLEDTIVPDTLITPEELAAKAALTHPAFVPLDGKAAKEGKNNMGIVQRKLQNGLRVNMVSMGDEPQRVSVRLYVPGGRMLESRETPASVLVGSRTVQEGGAFLDVTREEVELFCIDHLVMVDIIANEEALIFDFQTVTTPGPGGKVTGLEAVMQVLHIILTDFNYEESAFQRAKQIDKLDLDTVREAVTSQLGPDAIEVSMAGDVSIEDLELLALNYLGTVPKRASPRELMVESVHVKTMGRGKQLGVYLPDTDERAMGYLAGPSPNNWGILHDGRHISDLLTKATGSDEERRSHPLFGHVVLLVMQEVVNKRLFAVVREERRLTYDASFKLLGQNSIQGGWYQVSVTSNPSQVAEALRACKEALASLKGSFGIKGDSVQSAKRTIFNRFRADSLTNQFWVENLSGCQLDSMPLKSLRCISEFETTLNGVTVQDVRLLVEAMNFVDENMTACVGVTAPNPPPGMESVRNI